MTFFSKSQILIHFCQYLRTWYIFSKPFEDTFQTASRNIHIQTLSSQILYRHLSDASGALKKTSRHHQETSQISHRHIQDTFCLSVLLSVCHSLLIIKRFLEFPLIYDTFWNLLEHIQYYLNLKNENTLKTNTT